MWRARGVVGGSLIWGLLISSTVLGYIVPREIQEQDIKNVDTFLNSEDPVVRRLLGVEGELGSKLGLINDFVYRAIKLVGNYGEIYERNLGPFNLARGQNDLWTNGGLMYAPPMR